jgi:hypothetical protein
MKISQILLVAITWPLCIATASSPTSIIANGETTIKDTVGDHRIVVKVWTREIDIGKSDPARPPISHNSCTYTRVPCSIVDAVQIVIDGISISVPRSAFCDWSDLTSAKLSLVEDHPTLIASGGDASEAYEATIEFDTSRVVKRVMTSGMDIRHPLEITNYYDVSLDN